MVRGTAGIERLKAGDRVLVAEACTHHPIGEDIGRVKIPRWLRAARRRPARVRHVQGRDFPEDLSRYALVVHCGSCMGNRREMLSRILRGRQAGVPVTNYGLTIACSLGHPRAGAGALPRRPGGLPRIPREAAPVEVTT